MTKSLQDKVIVVTGAGRGIAPAQVPNAKISVCHGVGGMFAASGTIVFTNER